MLIHSFWNNSKSNLVLAIDNHAPTSLEVHGDGSPFLKKIKNLTYHTTTATGIQLRGDVYECNQVSFGNVAFNKVVVFDMPYRHDQKGGMTVNGVFGDNLMAKGIWKIDFIQHLITLTSSIDSMEKTSDMVKIPCRFEDNMIILDVVYPGQIYARGSIDLGYSGMVIMPDSLFRALNTASTQLRNTQSTRKSPKEGILKSDRSALGTVSLGEVHTKTVFVTDPAIRETLFGLAFFSRFKFIILDYIHQVVYLSRSTINPSYRSEDHY